MANKLHKLLS
jgi:hypothetical protein